MIASDYILQYQIETRVVTHALNLCNDVIFVK